MYKPKFYNRQYEKKPRKQPLPLRAASVIIIVGTYLMLL